MLRWHDGVMERRYRRRDTPDDTSSDAPPDVAGTAPERAERPAETADRSLSRDPGVPFPLQQNEQVLRVSRRHWVFLWPKTILLAGIAILPPILVGWVLSLIDAYDGVAAQVFWIVATLWILFWGARTYLNWYRYHHDMWVITNQRIVDCIKNHPFHLRLSSADLVNIQDMTVERNGVFATMLGYGDVVCQTAGAQPTFVLSGIPQPDDVQLLVDRERDRERMRR